MPRSHGAPDGEAAEGRTEPRWLMAVIGAVNLLGMLAAAIWCGTWALPGGIVGLAWSIAFVLGGFVVAAVVVMVPLTTVAERWSRVDPRDALLADLASFCVIAAYDSANPANELATVPRWLGKRAAQWRTNRDARAMFGSAIARTARDVEDRLHLVAPGSEPQIRADLRDLGAGIATTLRQHARDVIIGGVAQDAVLVHRLQTALVSAALGRWKELAADSHTPRAQRLLRRFGPRIITTAALVTAGLLGPVLLRDELGSAGQQLRITLLVAAALVLVETPKSALDKVAEYFKNH